MSNLGKVLGVVIGFILLGFFWSKCGDTILIWQSDLPQELRISMAFMVGIVLWHATGFDDAILFAQNLSLAKSQKERILCHLGLYASVLTMLVIVHLSGALVADTVRQFRWIIVFALVYIAWQTFPDEHWLKYRIMRVVQKYSGQHREDKNEKEEKGYIGQTLEKYQSYALYPFFLQFATFTANSSDDYVANTAAILILQEEVSRHALLSGVFLGAISMAWLVHRYHKKIIPQDIPAVRSWIFLGVATVIAVA